jgi:hypothetical protein
MTFADAQLPHPDRLQHVITTLESQNAIPIRANLGSTFLAVWGNLPSCESVAAHPLTEFPCLDYDRIVEADQVAKLRRFVIMNKILVLLSPLHIYLPLDMRLEWKRGVVRLPCVIDEPESVLLDFEMRCSIRALYHIAVCLSRWYVDFLRIENWPLLLPDAGSDFMPIPSPIET